MPRYIDADKLREVMERYDDYAVDIVDDAPTADVIERKKGKWIDYPIADGCLQCSVCGILRFEEANYCPNCGAEMKGEDNGLD